MSQELQLRHDTAANWATVAPGQGERVVDDTNDRLLVSDGSTNGGWPAAKLAEAVLNNVASNVLALGPNGSKVAVEVAEQLVSGLSGASVTASAPIPNGAVVLGVGARVTTAITGATSWQLGYGSGLELETWGNALGLSAGQTNEGQASPLPVYSATSIILTATGGNFTAGAVRFAVFYLSLTPPTS